MRKTVRALVLCATFATGCVPDAGRQGRLDTAYLHLLAAEDARPTEGSALDILVEATTTEQWFLREIAVRALGRLETPTLVPHIEALLDDAVPPVRQSAANALAQAFHTSEGNDALPILLARAAVEKNPEVRGTIAQSIGRLRMTSVNRRRAAQELVALSRIGDDDAPTSVLLGVVLGLEALVRQAPGEGVAESTSARLERLAAYGGFGLADVDAVRIRTLALSTLGQARRMSWTLINRGQQDRAAGVRATAARFLDAIPPSQKAELLRRSVRDPDPQTVIEAVRHVAASPRDPVSCRYLLATAAPGVPRAIRLIALDALALPCPNEGVQRSLLRETVESLSVDQRNWQPSAHALLSLARFYPEDATAVLRDFVGHTNPFVRAYAARAALSLDDERVLRELAVDVAPNVRTAAIEGLSELLGHRVDALLTEQLELDDPQLLMTAARLLEGTQDRAAVASRLLEAFERISAAERETWRDPRLALLERIRELGDARMSDRLAPFLSDYDAAVAQDVAQMLEGWNGRSYTALPKPLTREPLPSASALRQMEGASVLLHMQGGGTIEITLHPYLATTNVFRFVRLVQEGYFDGLTFHRWAANFVLQGGSPGANEYQGDRPFTRDEIGLLSHWRGTVGISTRGHDTGDGQIFINLADNVRLDHAYTIIGTVIGGMDVVDSLLEGAVIERAEIRPQG